MIETQIRITKHMHLELVLARLWRRGELHLQRHHFKSRLALAIKRLLVEDLERERRHCDLGLAGVGEEDVPARRTVAGEVGRVGQGNGVLFWFLLLGLEVAFCWIRVEEVFALDRWDVAGAGWDEAGFDDEMDQRGWDDVFLALDFEEGSLHVQQWELAGDVFGGVEVGFAEACCSREGGTLFAGQRHEGLDGHVVFLAGRFLDLFGDGGGEVRQLEEWHAASGGWDGLHELLAEVEGGEDGGRPAVGQADGEEAFIHPLSGGSELVLLCLERLVVQIETAKIGPQQSKRLPARGLVQVGQRLGVFGPHSKIAGICSLQARLEPAKSSIGSRARENVLELRAGAHRGDDVAFVHPLAPLAEHVAGAGDEDLLLGLGLRAIPPLPHQPGQANPQQGAVEDEHVLPAALRNEDARQRNAKTGALLAIRIAEFEPVALDVLVRQALVGFRDLDPLVVDRVHRLVERGVGGSLVGVHRDRELAIASVDVGVAG